MQKKRVLVAMSGGVDSSAAAALLLEQGYEVAGATMRLWPGGESAGENGEGADAAVQDARRVAQTLGIEHFVFDFSDVFRTRVIEPFVQDYICGRTPNPCVRCNRAVKFGALLDRAREMGFDCIATGHYARIAFDASSGRWQLLRAASGTKDQTYVLYHLTQEQLAHVLFPAGGLEKTALRAYAQRAGLDVADKPDSQEICFVPDNDYAGFIERLLPDTLPPAGDFVDLQGRVLGRHSGIYRYTVGQRKGLGITFGEPRYVVRIDAGRNEVVLGRGDEVFSGALTAGELSFLDGAPPEAPVRVTARIRYSAKDAPALLTMLPDGRCRVEFDQLQRAVTPGQSVVFYDGDRVLGGGVIERENAPRR